MSFKNLGINLSKSTATTSTTNTNTTSTPPSASLEAQSPFLSNMLFKGNESSPKKVSSSVAPTVVTVEQLETDEQDDSAKNHTLPDKADLIGLFDKFDVAPKDEKDDKEDEKELVATTDDVNETAIESNQETIEITKEKVVQAPLSMTIQPYIPEEYEPVADNSLGLDKIPQPESNVSSYANEAILSEKYPRRESPDPTATERKDISDLTVGDYENSPKEEFPLLVEETEPESSVAEIPRPIRQHSSSKVLINTDQINPNEQHQQSHKPFDFLVFLAQLKKKSADPIVRYIRSFLVSFARQGHTFTAEQRIKIIHEFKGFMNEKFALYEPFASMDDIDLENSREGLEKLIMNRLYEHCFPAEIAKHSDNYLPEQYAQGLEKDQALSRQLEKFSWVHGSHLDIDLNQLSQKKGELTFMDHAVVELNKINKYRAPRDKIICILNSCKIIFSFLKVSNQETNADSFVPILILIIIKAKVDNLLTNLQYIENFRGEEWLSHGETSYYLSSLQGAIGFVENLTINELTITEEEYNAHMEAWEAEDKRIRAKEEGRKRELSIVQPQPQHPPANLEYPQQSLSPSNILLTSAEMFTNSISNFFSPSPLDEQQSHYLPLNPTERRPSQIQEHQPLPPHPEIQLAPPQDSEVDPALLKETYKNMREIFPDLDKAILKDIIFINKGDMDNCVDACLQLVNDT